MKNKSARQHSAVSSDTLPPTPTNTSRIQATLGRLIDKLRRKIELHRQRRFIAWMYDCAAKMRYEGFEEAVEEIEKSAFEYEREIRLSRSREQRPSQSEFLTK